MPIQQKAKEQAAAMCATSSIPDTSVDIVINNGVNVSVLNIGVQFTCRIPSFSVIEVELRQGTFQFEHLDGSVRVYDGFLRSDQSFPDPSRPSTTPFAITIKDHCFVDVSCYPILLYTGAYSSTIYFSYRLKSFVKLCTYDT